MTNLKIRLDNDEQIEEIDNIAGQVGLNIIGIEIEKKPDVLKWVFLSKNKTHNGKPSKEITLPELRAMVKPMKEYLDANRNYEFVLSTEKDDGFIEIPEGAIRARFYPNDPEGLEFENAFCQWWHDENQDWFYYADYAVSAQHSRVVWQREQDEPFLTPECTLNEHCRGTVKSYIDNFHVSSIERKIPEIYGTVRVNPDLNDQYAEIEKVRQHNHYFKDVSNLNEIDVYMVLKLFNVTDPCLQHIAKKALCAGQRGHKNFNRDLRDILDTAKRAVEINNG